MNKIETGIKDLIVIEPQVFGDERGYFMETYSASKFKDLGIEEEFLQDNESMSKKGVLRGLHFQKHNPQGKLVRCTSGVIWDVAVDMRTDSETFGKWYGVELSSENKKMMYIPPMFAHGFVVLSDTATFNYKCTSLYHPQSDGGIKWDSEELGIVWPIEGLELTISDKDKLLSDELEVIEWSCD